MIEIGAHPLGEKSMERVVFAVLSYISVFDFGLAVLARRMGLKLIYMREAKMVRGVRC
jgi:hypothetical protein